jgi:hypothetical protein
MAWTARDLLRARDQGAVIVLASTGEEVRYKPRRDRDREPWRQEGKTARYSSAECIPQGRGGGPWALASLLRF